MKVSFKPADFERDLHDSVAACNEFMAKNHGEEPFYGFAIYVPTDYTDCGVYYNTDSLYQKTLQKYQGGKFGEKYRNDIRSQWELRWGVGDWTYFSDFDRPDGLRVLMKDMEKWGDNARTELDKEGLTQEDWYEYELAVMTSACRVLKKLYDDGVVDLLPRTHDFHSIISDHDEPLIYSYLRYERFLKDGSVIKPWDLDDDFEMTQVLKSFK